MCSRFAGGWRKFLLLFLFCLGCLSCGIEDYIYLNPVSSISMTLVNTATIRLPGNAETYFTHFIIYYRIYVSDEISESVTTSNMSNINSSMNSDYNTLYSYVSNDDIISTNIGSVFSNRGYYEIQIDGADIEDFLDSGSRGRTLTINFPQDSQGNPDLSIDGGTAYPLLRSSVLQDPRPINSRHFLNVQGLYDASNSTNNGDVQQKSQYTSSDRYTYAAMYIVASGIDDNYSPIYSRPAYIGVFRLPQQ
ncbi:hypothetical protein LJC14_06740 [Treponema sp. OttesenSCG-928-L16]|nr:hypothetical protein [Treponema sp. OttesenSCG-928-L16]